MSTTPANGHRRRQTRAAVLATETHCALSAPRRCLTCNTLVRGKCPTCDRAWARKPDSWRGGSTRRWRKTRAERLSLDPLCTCDGCTACDPTGSCRRLATEVDHIDGTDYATERNDLDMTRSRCHQCHAVRTQKQSGRG